VLPEATVAFAGGTFQDMEAESFGAITIPIQSLSMPPSPVTSVPSVPTALAEPAQPVTDISCTESRTAFWTSVLCALAATSITVGIMWDISWHMSVGRDTFWTPAHMAIYLGGVLGGCTGGWLAFRHTFLAGPSERGASVGVFGARAPLGAWVAMWGAVAMLTSAPFDDWWHSAYGLDVRIISPPHALLGLGMLGISVGALLVGLAHQNRAGDRSGNWLFIYIGGVFLTLGTVFVMELTSPNLQHAATFYKACAATFAFRLVALGMAGRISFPATRAAAVTLGMQCLMTWILPLFPAEPKLAPIFNPITHFVPPPFPILLIFPALAIDLVLWKWRAITGAWQRVLLALALGAAFLVVFLPLQWTFSAFLLTPQADNWFFAGNRYWGYEANPGIWAGKFFHLVEGAPNYDPLTASGVLLAWLYGSFSAWVGILWGGWMRKVVR
jgi:hypothetical protein